jgi:fatty acid synthase
MRNSIVKCHQILELKGINLMEIITSDDPNIFENILNSFVGIIAIQIAIVDVLKELGIEPDYIIGHSNGEVACGYADGCFTAEQTILAAYSRGLSFLQSEMIDGAMAAVAMPAEELTRIIPEDVDIACYNSRNLCTISGPAESVKTFVEELKLRKIFAKGFNCSHVAAHGRYMGNAGLLFHEKLCEIIPDPKQRSSKWLSTSVPKSRWENAELCSPQYHMDNLSNPVLFQDTLTMLPSDSLTIEISPHAIFQTILATEIPSGIHIGLAKRGNQDNVSYFLSALGR